VADAIVDALKRRRIQASHDARSRTRRLKTAWCFALMNIWGNNNTMTEARRVSGLAVLLLLVVPVVAQTNTPLLELPDLKIRLWQGEVQVRGAMGYKDNVTLSSTDPQGSAFWQSGVEALAFRLPAGGWQFSGFLDVTDIRYFDAPSVENEQQVVAVAELARLGHDWKSALGLSYLFQNQVFDVSANYYTNTTSVGQIVGHTLTPRWSVRKELRPFWVETEFSATRQIFEEPLDSYWQLGPRLTVGHSVGRRTELSLAYQWSWLDYDSREQVDAAGMSLTNTSLALQTHLIELAWTQTWDEKLRWRTTTRAGFEAVLDNGPGFFDYYSYRLTQELRYRTGKWEAKGRVRLSCHDYLTQPVSADDPDMRRKTLLVIGLQADRRLAKYLKCFASYTWERSLSNLAFDDYQANVVIGGFAATF
jgi:hypothetical protein